MQGDPGVGGQRFEDVTVDHGVVGHPGTGDGEAHQVVRLTGVHEVGTPGDVDRGMRQRLVHGDVRIAEAADALLVAQSLTEGRAQHDRGVLHGVVRLDIHVTAGGDAQIEAGVAAEGGQHVIEERHPGVDRDLPGAVEFELDHDVGLPGPSLDPRTARGAATHGAPNGWARSVLASRRLAARKASFSAANPMVTRRNRGIPTSRIKMPSSR